MSFVGRWKQRTRIRARRLALVEGRSEVRTARYESAADRLLQPGTHYTGLYDQIKDVDRKDAHARETVEVLLEVVEQK